MLLVIIGARRKKPRFTLRVENDLFLENEVVFLTKP